MAPGTLVKEEAIRDNNYGVDREEDRAQKRFDH